MKFWFITGIPGTGKTTIGNYLAENYGFIHLNVEDKLQEANPGGIIQKIIFDAMSEDKDLVITWGFQPGSDDHIVLSIKNLGAKLIWFDGDRESATREFIRRGGVPMELLDIQMKKINAVDINSIFNPITFNTFDNAGNFLEKDKIVKQLMKLTEA